MAIKKEFRRRLEFLYTEIDRALRDDRLDFGILPALYGVFTYMWCKSDKELQKK